MNSKPYILVNLSPVNSLLVMLILSAKYGTTITESPVSGLVTVSSSKPQCAQSTTLTFCLEDSTYPSDDIQREINANYGVFYKMYADVANQSTSSLVDGVSGDDEAKYDYAYYYGDKKNSLSGSMAKNRPIYTNYAFRDDFYQDAGGYICPAFIEYTSLYQATNARGEWQYIVNLKPWTQTVRLEQCFYPLAPCSYMSSSFKSQCVQKYSYQRLIAYEPQGRGLYTDIFRLPTACSCYLRPPRIHTIGALQSDASQSVGTSYGGGSTFGASTNYNSPAASVTPVNGGFNPVRQRRPPPRSPAPPGYAPEASQNSGLWFPRSPSSSGPSMSQSSDLTSGSNVEMTATASQDYDSRLVERRRLRPDGLSLADITSDPEVDPSEYGFDGHINSRSSNIVPQSSSNSRSPPRSAGYNGPPVLSGEASQMDANYYGGGGGGGGGPPQQPSMNNFNNGMNNNQPAGPPPGPDSHMWRSDGGPAESDMMASSPNNRLNANGGYRMTQGPGFYDYNSAQAQRN